MGLILILLAGVAFAQDSPFNDPQSLVWRAQNLEERGEITQAWLLYNQAAYLDPRNALAAGKAAQLRTKALDGATIVSGMPAAPELDPNDPLLKITDQDLREIERLAPPPALAPKDTHITLNLTGDAKTIYTRLFTHFGIDILFDGDFDNPTNRQVKLENATFDEAIYIANITTGCFVNPISPRIAMVIRDTDQKRREQERTVAITLPMPTTISSPEAQELGRAIQQIFELQRVSIDTVRGMMMIRDRWSKVKFAELSLNQMLGYRGQVMLDVEFYEVNEQSNLSFGFALPTSTTLVPLIKQATLKSFGTFGIGITSASLFASMTYSNTQSLYESQVRSLDGLPATVHIGDRYPIITQTTSFGGSSTVGGLATAPQVQFEDLGLSLKITPHLHGNGEISLELESDFKVLTGESNNNIPVIANRKFTGTVRLKKGEWAVAAGLVTQNLSISRLGLVGLSRIPGLSTNGRDRRIGQTLLVVKPRIISAPPSDQATRDIFTGPEQKFLAPTH
jgi:general secretion pathway protein D